MHNGGSTNNLNSQFLTHQKHITNPCLAEEEYKLNSKTAIWKQQKIVGTYDTFIKTKPWEPLWNMDYNNSRSPIISKNFHPHRLTFQHPKPSWSRHFNSPWHKQAWKTQCPLTHSDQLQFKTTNLQIHSYEDADLIVLINSKNTIKTQGHIQQSQREHNTVQNYNYTIYIF